MRVEPFEQKIRDIVSPSLEEEGYRVVRAKIFDQGGRKTLQIMIERIDGLAIIVDNCSEANHIMSALFDINDPIDGKYDLEVSSTGVDRPLVRLEDFAEYIGFVAKVEMALMLDGRRRFRGEIKKVGDGKVTIEVDTVDYDLPYSDMAQAKLVMTDELLASYAQKLESEEGDNLNTINQ